MTSTDIFTIPGLPLGLLLRDARRKAGLSMQAVATRLKEHYDKGMVVSTISDIEHGRRMPTASQAEALCKLYNVPQEVFDRHDNTMPLDDLKRCCYLNYKWAHVLKAMCYVMDKTSYTPEELMNMLKYAYEQRTKISAP